MRRFFQNRTDIVHAIPINGYIEVKALFVHEFKMIPCITIIDDIDVGKAYEFVQDHFSKDVLNLYQHCSFDHEKAQAFFNMTVFVLRHKRMIELSNVYAAIFFGNNDYAWETNLLREFAKFKMVKPEANHKTVIGFARQAEVN